jgi:hypothetical protein
MKAGGRSRENHGPHRPFLEGFLLGSTWFSLSGWGLSLLGALDRSGYAVSLLLGGIALALWLRRRRTLPTTRPRFRWKAKRFLRPLPAIYLLIFILGAVGGALYPPNNYDALTYRLPQLLHWLDAGRWHWIATSNDVLNIAGAGYSWLMAPFLALTHSDRAFFLPNLVAFALLPGLFFSAARGCGVAPRVAWHWMWIVPSGYCFALQAGSIANDLLPAAYLLAALALALRARRFGMVRDAWFSILAAALATGVKVVVLPLGLPWLIAIAPSWRILLRRPFFTTAVIAIGLAVSFLPTAVLNRKHTGDWSGDPTNATRLRADQPLYAIVGNTLLVAGVNLQPPVWPFPGTVNSVLTRYQEGPAGRTLRAHFPRFELRWGEMAGEDGAGIGLGIFVLGAVTLATSFVWRRRIHRPVNGLGAAIGSAALLAWLAYAAKMSSEAAPRLIASYYPFLLLHLLLLPVNELLVRRGWWRWLALACAVSIVPTLILTPARPLWPAQRILAQRLSAHPDSAFLQRSALVYDVFARRHDYLAPMKKYIPANARTVGFVPSGNDLESTLWRPFGQRRVVEVLQPSRTDRAIGQLSGSVVISSRRGLSEHFHLTAEEFAAAVGGRVIGEETLTLKAVIGPEPWCAIAID